SWVRGLKLTDMLFIARRERVASFMGAWIEICFSFSSIQRRRVASFMGAWIEIKDVEKGKEVTIVASFMGAWIEITCSVRTSVRVWSHPSWVRGLKYVWFR